MVDETLNTRLSAGDMTLALYLTTSLYTLRRHFSLTTAHFTIQAFHNPAPNTARVGSVLQQQSCAGGVQS